ncbi:MAG TPA: hypothetical protein VFX25_35340 [Streptosporangiaceae bacterium]|nr:hypothetical protein [Streptosporangiaceae bacterium]
MRPAALGWLPAIAAFAALLGTVAQSSTKDAMVGTSVQAAIGRLGGHDSAVAGYLGPTFLLIALMIALIAAGQAAAIRSEEADGHLENLIVRPVRRSAWLAERLLLSAGLLVAASLLAGVAARAGAGPRGGYGSRRWRAGLNVVPSAVLLLDPGAPGPGNLAAPDVSRRLQVPDLVVPHRVHGGGGPCQSLTAGHLAVLPHGAAPAASPDWASAAAIAGLGICLAVTGGLIPGRS